MGTDGKTRVSSSKIDLPAAKPCKDTEGETDISIAGKPATCAKLAPYCKVAQMKKQVLKFCPKTCGVCKDANPSSKSASAVKNKSEKQKKDNSKNQNSEAKATKKSHDDTTAAKKQLASSAPKLDQSSVQRTARRSKLANQNQRSETHS